MDSTWVSDLEDNHGDIGIRYTPVSKINAPSQVFPKNQRALNCFFQVRKMRKLTQFIVLRWQRARLHKTNGPPSPKRRALPEKSTRFLDESLVFQWEEETKLSFPTNPTWRFYASFVLKKDVKTIGNVLPIVLRELEYFKSFFGREKNALAQVAFISGGGQMNQKNPNCCLPWREEGTYHAYMMLVWKDKWLERDMRAFSQRVKDALRPFAIDSMAGHTNFPELSLAPDRHEEAWYGKNLPKLREVKRTWDPDNYFDHPQGVKSRGVKRSAPQRGKRLNWKKIKRT